MQQQRLCRCGHEPSAHLVNRRKPNERGACSICDCTCYSVGRRRRVVTAASSSRGDDVVISRAEYERIKLSTAALAKAVAIYCAEVDRIKPRAPSTGSGSTSIDPHAVLAAAVAAGAPRKKSAPTGVVGNGGLRRILTVLAQTGVPMTDAQIGARAKLSAKGGTYGTYLSRARGEGWIVDRIDGMRLITAAGVAALGSFERLPPPGEQRRQYWRGKLGGGGMARIFECVCFWGATSGVSLRRIGEETSLEVTGGSFNTYVSKLRALMLVVDVDTHHGKGLQLAEDLR